MAYLGRQPISGNFQILDAIVATTTDTYALTKDTVAVFPQTPSNCIVSLNGVIQAPTDSYTISGSDIVFASALTGSDSIDFITVLGDVLSIGTPTDGTVTTAKIADGAVTSAKLSAGKVLQVLSTTKTDTFTTSSGTFVDITGLSVSITPTSTSSKILVLMNSYLGNQASSYITFVRLMRDSTAISIGDTAGNRTRATAHQRLGDTYEMSNNSGIILDSPNTTSATTYKLQMAIQTGGSSTGVLNRTGNDSDHDYQGRTASTITVMEIAG
jgi:hypothetical protein